MKRSYTQKKRAVAAAETRHRIVEATAALHAEIGPRATTISEIARRAGVDRLTVYKHFPDESALVDGCQAHWLERHPPPNLASLQFIGHPDERLRAALHALWDWYADTRAMTANVLRDGPMLMSFAGILAAMQAQRDALVDTLAHGRAKAQELRPVLLLVTDFHTWETLVANGSLPRDNAVDLLLRWANSAR
jgi:AcrR family transcriptional regulator